MKNKILSFVQSKYYLMSISLITFLLWFFNINSVGPKPSFDPLEVIGISLFAITISILLILFKETIYTFPLLIHTIIMLSNQNMTMDTLNEFYLLYVSIGILVASFIYHVIHYKVHLRLKTLGLGLAILALVYIVSMLGYFLDGKPFELSLLVVSLMGFIFLMIYVFYASTNKQPILNYLFKTFYYFSIVVILQTFVMIIFFIIDHLSYGSLLGIIELGIDTRWGYIIDGFFVRLNVGWGLGNNIGGVLAMFLPIHMYFLFKEKTLLNKIIALITLFLSIVTIVLTTSRGAYLGVLAFGLLFIYGFIKFSNFDFKKYKKQLIISLILLLLLAIPVLIFAYDFLINFLNSNSLLNGREADWSDAIKYFLESPLFGKSWYSDTWGEFNNSFRSYHNTILHTLATMGLIGLAALIYHHIDIARLFIKKWSFETFVVLGVLVITHTHGMVDNTYYSPIHMFSLILLFIGVENIVRKEKNNT